MYIITNIWWYLCALILILGPFYGTNLLRSCLYFGLGWIKKIFISIPGKLSYRFSPSSWGVCYSCELRLLLSIHHHSNVSQLVFCYFLISQESKIKVTVGIYFRNNWRKLHSCVLWTTICYSIIVKILQVASRCQTLTLNTQTGCCESTP